MSFPAGYPPVFPDTGIIDHSVPIHPVCEVIDMSLAVRITLHVMRDVFTLFFHSPH